MKIIKPLHVGVLHKSFSFKKTDVFAVSIPIAFSLVDGEIQLEQKLWSTISEELDGGIFDVGMPKHHPEVLASGSFYSPKGLPVKAGSVRVQLGNVDKELLVFPERQWRKVLSTGFGIKSNDTFSELPINYENAFGGEGYKLNPEGKGYGVVETKLGYVQFLPNIEYKDRLVTSPSRQPEPAGFSRLDMMWEPRLAKAGTYDEKYLAEQMPGLPDDIDWSYFNEAPKDQWLEGYPKGGENFTIENMHPEKSSLSGQLPEIYGRAFVNQVEIDGKGKKSVTFKEIPTKLDTVWFFPKAEMGVVIYRGTMKSYSDDASDISDLLLACENRADPARSLAHYEDQMIKRSDPDESFKYLLNTAPLIAEGMKCGFKQVQEDYDFPLELLGNKNATQAATNQIDEANNLAEKSKQEVIDKLKEAGVDPGPFLEKMKLPNKSPEEEKLETLVEKMAPGMLTDPDNLDFTKLDLKVLDEIKALTESIATETIEQAKNEIKAKISELKARLDSFLFVDTIKELEDKLAEIELPPVWPRSNMAGQAQDLRDQIARAKMEVQVLREQGVSEDDLPKIDVDLESVEARLNNAESSLKDGYLMGAHMMEKGRSPHPGLESELKQKLLNAYTAGESLANLDFACIDLSGEDLRGIDLSGCYLEGVDFSGCNLSNANLSKSIMATANLSDVVLHNANLQGANIGATILKNTDFTGSNLDKVVIGNGLLERTNFSRCIMNEINFLDTTFEKAVFDHASMRKCNFVELDLTECSFVGSDMAESNFIKTVLEKADFTQAILDSINFVEAKADEVIFRQAQMNNSRFVGGCELNKADFTDAVVDKSCLRENQLNYANFSGSQLNEADLSGSCLHFANFSGATAIRAQFMKSDLTSANMSLFNLMEGSLYKAHLVSVDFSGSNMYCVNFLDATLGDNLYKNTNLDQTILQDWRP